MNIIYETYNIHHSSIDVYTYAGYFLRIDCNIAEEGLKTGLIHGLLWGLTFTLYLSKMFFLQFCKNYLCVAIESASPLIMAYGISAMRTIAGAIV